MNMRIATVADAAGIRELRLAMLRELAAPLPAELPAAIDAYLHRSLADGSCLCALSEEAGQPVAAAMLCLGQSVPDEINRTGRYAILASVYTLPEFRGQGRMERLLRYLFEQGRQAGVREILATAEEKALPLYERLGFTLPTTGILLELD